MQRRHFLKNSSFAVIAAAGLPSAVKKYHTSTPSNYKSERISNKANQVQYSVILTHETIEKFEAATAEQKFISLNISAYDTSNSSTASRTADCKYAIEKSERIDDTNNIWKLKVSPSGTPTGDEKLLKELPKDFKFLLKPGVYADILGKKDKTFTHMEYNVNYTPPADGDCFLTTACVQHQQLADNCDELETLRGLRDQFMSATPAGRNLVDQYSFYGPAIVTAINQCENSSEIYQYMYTNMIVPSVSLVKEGKLEEAMEYYSVFVKVLHEKMLMN